MDMAWFDASGSPMDGAWHDPATRILQMLVNGAYVGQRSVLVVVNGSLDDVEVTLPTVPGLTAYRPLWDSAWSGHRRSTPMSSPVP